MSFVSDLQRCLDIAHRLRQASPDELRVIECEVERLEAGREVYGAFHAATDERDFGAEGWDELIDALLYARMEAVRATQRLEAVQTELEDKRVVLTNVIRQREAMREYVRKALEESERIIRRMWPNSPESDAAQCISEHLTTGLRVSGRGEDQAPLPREFAEQMLRGTRWGNDD